MWYAGFTTMKKEFFGFYSPTEPEFKELWSKAIFTFDTNVLLNFYRVGQKTVDVFMEILEALKDNIWLSHQAAYEYQKNRLSEINRPFEAYSDIPAQFTAFEKKLENDYQKHPVIETKVLVSIVQRAREAAEDHLRKARKTHPEWQKVDSWREKLDKLFQGRIGKPFSDEELQKNYKEIAARYASKISPGYCDVKKPEPDRYGDALLWFEIMDYAKTEQKPIILVTDEQKEDWWWLDGEDVIGPKPELRHEFSRVTGQDFYMYKSNQFIKYAPKMLSLKAEAKEIKDAANEIGAAQHSESRIEYWADRDIATRFQVASVVFNWLIARGKVLVGVSGSEFTLIERDGVLVPGEIVLFTGGSVTTAIRNAVRSLKQRFTVPLTGQKRGIIIMVGDLGPHASKVAVKVLTRMTAFPVLLAIGEIRKSAFHLVMESKVGSVASSALSYLTDPE